MQVPLRPDQEAHLIKLCTKMGRTPEDFVREAVLTFMEDYEDGHAGQEILGQIGRGQVGTVSLEALIAKYGVEVEANDDSGEADGQAGPANSSTSVEVLGKDAQIA